MMIMLRLLMLLMMMNKTSPNMPKGSIFPDNYDYVKDIDDVDDGE